jgi:hypothetical protein
VEKLDSFFLHRRGDELGHLLIEPSENHRPHHHGGVETKTVEETGTLQTDVSSTDDQRFSRRTVQTENIVAGYAVFHGARYVGVARSSANSYQEILRRECAFSLFGHRYDSVRIFERSQSVDIFYFPGENVSLLSENVATHLLISKFYPGHPVNRFHVILNGFFERCPIVSDIFLVGKLPPITFGILQAKILK